MTVISNIKTTSVQANVANVIPEKSLKLSKGKILGEFSDYLSKGPELAPPNLNDFKKPTAPTTSGQ